ncbi:MAG: hypothetical protein P8M16_07165 [Acidimicrobiales bacterium]|nr:hypothetical protein [Acidimicrobiales bacterium]
MASFDSETFIVELSDLTDLADVLLEVALAPGSWVNVEPDVDESLRADVPGLFAWFSARGSQVPVGTFVAGSDRDAPSVGLDHSTGRGAGGRLSDAGVVAPSGWLLRQDHPKRGLIWEFASQSSLDGAMLAEFLVAATGLFCPLLSGGRFRVAVHTPRT